MKRLLFVFAALSFSCQGWCKGLDDLETLCQILDQAIDSSHIYLQQKTELINKLKKDFLQATDDEQRFERGKRVYQEYIPFENDSPISTCVWI